MIDPNQISTETVFVNGDREVVTGHCGTFGTDWQKEAWGEARRIADGLGGTVVEDTPLGKHVGPDWTRTNLQRLAVVLDGRVVARVHSGFCEPNPGK